MKSKKFANKKHGEMETIAIKKLIEKVSCLYSWLDEQVALNSVSQDCKACGKCCCYKDYGHRIYVTSAEIIYLKHNLIKHDISTIQKHEGRCPFMIENKCSVRNFRFAPCRIYFCESDHLWQNKLSEEFLNKIKLLSHEFNLDYRYIEIGQALEKIHDVY